METIENKNDHEDFKKSMKRFEKLLMNADGVSYFDLELNFILKQLESRIRILELKNNKLLKLINHGKRK